MRWGEGDNSWLAIAGVCNRTESQRKRRSSIIHVRVPAWGGSVPSKALATSFSAKVRVGPLALVWGQRRPG